MPSIDSGRYFLTVFLPIKNNVVVKKQGMDIPLSPVQAIRDELSVWPTAQQDPWSIFQQEHAPFATNLKTHFTRVFVLSDVVYNGRESKDTLIAKIEGINPVVPQPVDELTTPYLAYIADFDAPNGSKQELESYLEELWTQNSEMFGRLFCYCYGFDEVKDAKTFAAFMRRGEVETTMPFNDYWANGVPVAAVTMPWAPVIFGLSAVFVFGLAVLIYAGAAWYWFIAGLLALIVLAIWLAYKSIMKWGNKPFPMAPNSDLKSVLKSLHLQRHFVEFIEQTQGMDDQELFDAFTEFKAQNQPHNVSQPTQKPGVIGMKGLVQ